MRLQHHPFSGAGQHGNQERRAPPREQQSGCCAQRHEHDPFGEQLTDQSAAAGADREPDRDLVLPGRRSGEQQVGNIRAPDEENDTDDPHHDQQRLGVGAAKLVGPSRGGHEHETAEVSASLARHAHFRHVGVPHAFEVRARLLDGRIGGDSCDHAEPPALLRLQALFNQHHGNRDVERRADLKPEESGRCDADDRHPLGADLNVLSEHRRIPGEPARPESVADDRDRAVRTTASRLGIVGGCEQAPVDRAHAEQVEVGPGGILPAHPLRHPVDRHLELALGKGGDTGKEAVVIAKALEARIWRAAAAAGLPAGVIDEEQLLWILDRECLHQHGVDQAEDGGIGANPECERQEGHDRERRRRSQEPDRVRDVAAQLVEQAQADGLAAFLLTRQRAAEIGERTPASFRLGQTAPAQIGLVELQVDLHLVLHLTLEVSAPAADSKPRLHARDQTHTSSGTASSANPVVSEIVSLTRLS